MRLKTEEKGQSGRRRQHGGHVLDGVTFTSCQLETVRSDLQRGPAPVSHSEDHLIAPPHILLIVSKKNNK